MLLVVTLPCIFCCHSEEKCLFSLICLFIPPAVLITATFVTLRKTNEGVSWIYDTPSYWIELSQTERLQCRLDGLCVASLCQLEYIHAVRQA